MAKRRGMERAAWLDVQYNNRARVPEFADILARWASRSAEARARMGGLLDVRYGDGPNETLDVFGVGFEEVPTKPVLVFIHGGWWRSLDKSDHSFVAQSFVEAGAVVVLPNYALCPAVTVGDIACQMTRAMAHVYRHAAQWGGDVRRLVLAGHSAGGHLATLMMSCDWATVDANLPAHWVDRVVALSGLSDLETVAEIPFLQADLQLSAADGRALSPARFAPPRHARLLNGVGALESEEFLRQHALLRDRWGAQVVPVSEGVAGADHFTVLDDLARPGGRFNGLVQAWLQEKAGAC